MVAATIREFILSGELPPGMQLRQRDLAARLGVSQTPVREALRRLESEGLVRCDTHRGSTVTEAELGATEENYQIRAALESLASSLAATRITGEELDALEALNAELETMSEDDERYGELNRQFHFSIYEYARSPLLISFMQLLWRSIPQGPKVTRSHAESARQHQMLIAALRARDPDRAAEITRQHILGTVHLERVGAERPRTGARTARPSRQPGSSSPMRAGS